jgi:hypothetical protein
METKDSVEITRVKFAQLRLKRAKFTHEEEKETNNPPVKKKRKRGEKPTVLSRGGLSQKQWKKLQAARRKKTGVPPELDLSQFRCSNCNEYGHYARACLSFFGVRCFNCTEYGHYARACPRPKNDRQQ